MNGAEERIRDGLQRLAEPVEPGVNLAALVADGERLRRSRRGGWAVAGVAAASVSVLLAWPGLVGGSMPAVPAPVATPQPARPVADRVVLEFSQWDQSLVYDQVEIEVVRTGDIWAVDVTAVADGTPEVTGSYTANAGEFWSVPVVADLVVALIPEQATWVTSVDDGWEPVDTGWLSDLHTTAVAVQRTGGETEIGGMTWQAPDGLVRTSQGDAATADLTHAGVRVTAYRDEALGVWGYIDHANGGSDAKPLATEPVGMLVGLSATKDGDYFLDSIAVGFLPPGGADPDLSATQRGDIEWTSAPLGDTGQLAILVIADRIKQGEPLLESISYTDGEGNRVTYDPYQLGQPKPENGHGIATCTPLDDELLAAANEAGSVGGVARYVSGQMVQATEKWWLVAVKAQINDHEYAEANGINDQGLMAFATNAPAGGTNWIPLSDDAEWDGTTPTGQTIPDWREYRLDALGCAGPG